MASFQWVRFVVGAGNSKVNHGWLHIIGQPTSNPPPSCQDTEEKPFKTLVTTTIKGGVVAITSEWWRKIYKRQIERPVTAIKPFLWCYTHTPLTDSYFICSTSVNGPSLLWRRPCWTNTTNKSDMVLCFGRLRFRIRFSRLKLLSHILHSRFIIDVWTTQT